jgi:type II secretory pathway pseudopilin PulG
MKLLPPFKIHSPSDRLLGFTLVEMVLALAIYAGILILALVGVQIFAMREFQLGGTKMAAMQNGLQVLNHIRDDIRSSKLQDVGNCSTVSDPSTYQPNGTNLTAMGSALRIFPTTNTFPITIYYLDSSSAVGPNGSPTNGGFFLNVAYSTNGTTFSAPQTLASYVTNLTVFDEEDCWGNVLTNNANNRTVRMELDFYQWEYPIGYIGGVGANAYDFYKLTTKISRRLID